MLNSVEFQERKDLIQSLIIQSLLIELVRIQKRYMSYIYKRIRKRKKKQLTEYTLTTFCYNTEVGYRTIRTNFVLLVGAHGLMTWIHVLCIVSNNRLVITSNRN